MACWLGTLCTRLAGVWLGVGVVGGVVVVVVLGMVVVWFVCGCSVDGCTMRLGWSDSFSNTTVTGTDDRWCSEDC